MNKKKISLKTIVQSGGDSRWRVCYQCGLPHQVFLKEMSMNEKCNRQKSFLSVTLPYRCNSYVSQVSQKGKIKFCDTSSIFFPPTLTFSF